MWIPVFLLSQVQFLYVLLLLHPRRPVGKASHKYYRNMKALLHQDCPRITYSISSFQTFQSAELFWRWISTKPSRRLSRETGGSPKATSLSEVPSFFFWTRENSSHLFCLQYFFLTKAQKLWGFMTTVLVLSQEVESSQQPLWLKLCLEMEGLGRLTASFFANIQAEKEW